MVENLLAVYFEGIQGNRLALLCFEVNLELVCCWGWKGIGESYG